MTSVAVVGAGFGGVGAAVMLRRAGYEDVVVFERGERVGGVWPTTPTQALPSTSHRTCTVLVRAEPAVVAALCAAGRDSGVLEDVAREHGVLDRLGPARRSRTRAGTHRAPVGARDDRGPARGGRPPDGLRPAVGPRVPPIPGLDTFAGPVFHTARWRHDVDLAGKRVAVIGTGCSAIQVVPAIEPVVGHVDVYQRSPVDFPKMDGPYGERAQRLFERFPIIQRLDRAAVLAFQELGALAMTRRRSLLRLFRALGRRQITKAIEDPELRRKVTPTDEMGCKHILLTTTGTPRSRSPTSTSSSTPSWRSGRAASAPRTARERPADVLMLATGFRTHGFVAPMEVVGDGGRQLAEEWGQVPRAYLGLSVPGFPNLFLLYGPNTNGGTGSVIYTIEAGVRHVIAALRELERAHGQRIEVRRHAADAFDRELRPP